MEEETARQWLEALMDAYGTSLLRMCTIYLHDASLAQDAVQDTFLKAYRHRDSFRRACSEKTWLIRIAVHTCRDYQRSAWFKHTDPRKSIEELPESTAPDPFRDHTVLDEVGRLPKRYREVILLRYYQGMKIREAAQALHISESAVKQRCQRANAMLQERLKEWYFDEE